MGEFSQKEVDRAEQAYRVYLSEVGGSDPVSGRRMHGDWDKVTTTEKRGWIAVVNALTATLREADDDNQVDDLVRGPHENETGMKFGNEPGPEERQRVTGGGDRQLGRHAGTPTDDAQTLSADDTDGDDDAQNEDDDNYGDMSVEQLRDAARRRSLPSSGNREALLSRLRENRS